MKNKKVYIVAAVMILSLLGIVLTIYFEYKNQPKMNDMTSINQDKMPSIPGNDLNSTDKGNNNWQDRQQNRDNNKDFNPFDRSLSVISIVIISVCSLIFVLSLLILIKSKFGKIDF